MSTKSKPGDVYREAAADLVSGRYSCHDGGSEGACDILFHCNKDAFPIQRPDLRAEFRAHFV